MFCKRLHLNQVYQNFSQIRLKSFITTPIFYVNGNPHIGHLYTALLADAAHRWELLKGGRGADLSRFKLITGTDEHGVKIQTAAANAGLQPQEFVDQNSEKFRKLFKKFGIANTDFIRTTEDRHKRAVTQMWNTLLEKGFIKKGSYQGWYSTIDECFYSEKDVERTSDGNGMITKETKNPVEWVEEENYMFDLGKLYEPLKAWLNSGVLYPENFLPLALSALRSDEWLSISRDSKRLKWGIRVPGTESQTIYVWLDALVNYLTAAGYPDIDKNLWPPDIQIIGKDIVKFHALYWPAFLMVVGLPLPKKLFIHSHWLVDGRKMSKSYGNVLDPHDLAETLTVDGLRYFLLRQGTPQDDSNITISNAIDLINAELVNALGNLLSRCTVDKLNPKQCYPNYDEDGLNSNLKEDAGKLINGLNSLQDAVSKAYNDLYFYRGLELIFEQIRNANAFLEIYRPWNMKEGSELSSILFISYETIRIASILLQPIVPEYSDRALSRLGISEEERLLDATEFGGGKMLNLNGRKLGQNNGNVMTRISVKELKPERIEKKKNRKKFVDKS